VGIAYYRRVLAGVARCARAYGDLTLRIASPTDASARALHAIDRAGYDGMILGSFKIKPEEAARLRTPAVTVANDPDVGLMRVVSDDCEVGHLVARHLLNRGFRHLAFWDNQTVFGQERWNGFAAEIIAARGEEGAPVRISTVEQPLHRWLERLPRPLGMMTVTDARGADAIDACHDLGLRVPQDVAVVGVDDDDLYADLNNPPMSSAILQTDRIGFLAAEHLMRLVRGEKVPRVTLVPPGPLVVRQSSDAVATSDPLVAQAVAYMEQHLAQRSNIGDLSGAMGVPRRMLETRFKAALGRAPGQTLARLKIERAQALLATTSLPLKQIAVAAGFGTPVRMGQAFRQYTGQTPLGYRRGFLPVAKTGKANGAAGDRKGCRDEED
jgi:LacI family transcriptional regulator